MCKADPRDDPAEQQQSHMSASDIHYTHHLSWVAHDKVGCVDPPVFEDALRKQPHIISPPRVHIGSTCVLLRFPNFGSEGVGVMSGIEEGTFHTAQFWTNMDNTVQMSREA